ncbi:Gp15 family bacteriophage protein [Halalkalibacter sp. AB-rgal2]|uniref:Gp15 family bacteriophage protein n=1 Tax=Halalkalibacter sp. AB-rgal2 TaxID=3242695 RepID=UPI00359D0B91
MFTLFYPLETKIEIDGTIYQVDMSFDNILRYYDLLNDDDIHDVLQVEAALRMLIGCELKYDIQTKWSILQKIHYGLIASEKSTQPAVDIQGNPMPIAGNEGKQPYSIKQDAAFIYASFMQDYGIDLIEEQGKLDWRKFLALLDGLKGDTRFKEVVNIRTMELPTGKGSAKQREQINKAKKVYQLKE